MLLYSVYQVSSILPVSQRCELKTSPCEPTPKGNTKPDDANVGRTPRAGSFLFGCGVEYTPRWIGTSGLQGTEGHPSGDLEVLGKCVMRRYNLGEGDQASTQVPFFVDGGCLEKLGRGPSFFGAVKIRNWHSLVSITR